MTRSNFGRVGRRSSLACEKTELLRAKGYKCCAGRRGGGWRCSVEVMLLDSVAVDGKKFVILHSVIRLKSAIHSLCARFLMLSFNKL